MARARERTGFRIDEIDAKIIAALQRDGRRSFKRMGDELGLSDGAIRYRVQRLETSGILQVVGIADPLKVGFDLMAMVGVRVQAGTVRTVSAALAALAETSYVAMTAGRYDLFAELVCRNTAHFQEVLDIVHTTPGVIGTEAHLITGITKMSYGWDVLAGEDGARPDEGAGAEVAEDPA